MFLLSYTYIMSKYTDKICIYQNYIDFNVSFISIVYHHVYS